MNDPIYFAPSPVPPPPRRRPGVVPFVSVAIMSALVSAAATLGLFAFGGVGHRGVAYAPASSPLQAAVRLAVAGSNDLVGMVAAAKESVVTITAQGIDSGFSGLDIPATGVGSGIVVTADGLILTNNHVVEGAKSLTVTTEEGADIDATVVDTDPSRDIAVIRASGGGLSPATLGNSDQLQVGQTVMAIGSPLGEFTESVTQGIVSALGRNITVTDESTGTQKELSGLIQTDAAINPGNSGGPLIDAAGQVVGMNTALSRGSEGIGFAIPIDVAKDMIRKAAGATS